MSPERIDVSNFLVTLASGQTLSDSAMAALVTELDQIVRYDPDVYYECVLCRDAWFDAWDALKLLRPHHRNALPHLAQVVSTPADSEAEDEARIWALKAIGIIRGDISEQLPIILEAVRDKNREVRQEAARTLRNCGYGYLVKRRWYNPFDWTVR